MTENSITTCIRLLIFEFMIDIYFQFNFKASNLAILFASMKITNKL